MGKRQRIEAAEARALRGFQDGCELDDLVDLATGLRQALERLRQANLKRQREAEQELRDLGGNLTQLARARTRVGLGYPPSKRRT